MRKARQLLNPKTGRLEVNLRVLTVQLGRSPQIPDTEVECWLGLADPIGWVSLANENFRRYQPVGHVRVSRGVNARDIIAAELTTLVQDPVNPGRYAAQDLKVLGQASSGHPTELSDVLQAQLLREVARA